MIVFSPYVPTPLKLSLSPLKLFQVQPHEYLLFLSYGLILHMVPLRDSVVQSVVKIALSHERGFKIKK